MRELVEALCSERCAGRAPGTPGGREGRRIIIEALISRGLDVVEQPVPGCGGANLLAMIPAAGAAAATTERWVLLGAHHDHLGQHGGETFWGADDNAAAVAILVQVAGALAYDRPTGRGVLIAFFDGEEPPHFLHEGMGSAWYVAHPPVPLDCIDMMVCMDLVGHAIGGPALSPEVRASIFALGAERSQGTAAHVDAIARAEPGVRIRRLDAEVLSPVSDYVPFWKCGVPFVFLTAGRAAYYHTPDDTPDKLDYPKMAALARWLQRWARETCERFEPQIRFEDARDDAATARTLVDLAEALEPSLPAAAVARAQAQQLLELCDSKGQLPASARDALQFLLRRLEASVA